MIFIVTIVMAVFCMAKAFRAFHGRFQMLEQQLKDHLREIGDAGDASGAMRVGIIRLGGDLDVAEPTILRMTGTTGTMWRSRT